jgi:hypothetical protein
MPSQRSDLIQMDILFSRHCMVFLISSQFIFSDLFLDHITHHPEDAGFTSVWAYKNRWNLLGLTPTFVHLLRDSIYLIQPFSLYP